MRQFASDYVRGLGMSAHNNALAYGYSVTASASFAVLTHTAGPVTIAHTCSRSSPARSSAVGNVKPEKR